MLKLETFARDAISWHLGFEDLVLVAFDIENSGRSAFLGKRQPSKDDPNLQLTSSAGRTTPLRKLILWSAPTVKTSAVRF